VIGGNGSLAGAHRLADLEELAGQSLAIAGGRPRSATHSG